MWTVNRWHWHSDDPLGGFVIYAAGSDAESDEALLDIHVSISVPQGMPQPWMELQVMTQGRPIKIGKRRSNDPISILPTTVAADAPSIESECLIEAKPIRGRCR